ncbi:MAG TPA: peptidoglycan DD-metalloendopeptidase family protein [Chitinophagaceae bacterium]|jgi:murein DD-endopeptidase MepM/ murein hydrolase activator NlpD|nr:peptidoglycan DD-metalloendopeptidase family protein [Chitinophagaceae bacterium]
MPAPSLISLLKIHQQEFHPVVPFNPATDKLLSFDLTAQNKELTDAILSDTNLFTAWVNEKISHANARYGIGGYAEHRTVYRVSKVFDAQSPGEEPRRLHLGTDIWGKPGTAVMAPLSGIVHSFAFNDQPGNYGATIILSHAFEGLHFYTLYGHLSLNSIKNIQEGDRVDKGEIFASFGIPSENGQWPPHLHFQLILDMSEWSGDYPGVCRFSEKEQWLANSPDPDIILQLNQYIR